MIVPTSRVLVFAGAGVLALAALVVMDDEALYRDVDTRTGFVVAPGLERIDAARALGEARAALEELAALGGLQGPAEVRAPYAALALEVEAPRAADRANFERQLVGAHVDGAVLARAAEDSRAARERLAERVRAAVLPGGITLAPASALAAESTLSEDLAALFADGPIARAAAAFFAPVVHGVEGENVQRYEDSHIADAQREVSPGIDLSAFRLEERGPSASASDARRIAELYRSEGRERAALRWRRYAYAAEPLHVENALALVDALLQAEEASAALAVLVASDRSQPEVLARIVQLSAWDGQRVLEAAALMQLDSVRGLDADERSRLVDVLLFLGRAAEARPHAERLAVGATTRAARELPVRLATEDGDVDGALRLLRELQRVDPEEPHWLEEELALLENDLRLEELEQRLQAVTARAPEGFEGRYERLLRQRWSLAPLLALLTQRALDGRATRDERDEAIGIARALGDDAAFERLLELDLAPGGDPVRALARLPLLERLGLSDARARIAALLATAALDSADTARALEALDRAEPDEGLLRAVLRAGAPHLSDPAVELALLQTLDSLDPALALAVARQAADTRPADREAQERLARRASWLQEPELELAARERIAQLADVSLGSSAALENDRARAALLWRLGQPDAAHRVWRGLLDAHGAAVDAGARLEWRQGALAAAAAADPALLARELDALPDSDVERDATSAALEGAAEELFQKSLFAVAEPLWARAVALAPERALALRRLGQVRSWSDDPRGALPPLERLAALPEGQDVEACFLLAEVRYAVGQRARALELYRAVIDRAAIERGDERLWRARSLVRVGEAEDDALLEEGLAELASLARHAPRGGGLALDLAEGLLAAGRPAAAREALAPHLAVAPDDVRALRLSARAERECGDRSAARAALMRAVIAAGPTPQQRREVELDLARQLDADGEWREARAATMSALSAAPSEHEVRALDQDLAERLAALAGALLRWRSVGDDRLLGLALFGSVLLDDEETRLIGALEHNQFSGRAAAVDAGRSDIEADVTSLRLTLDRRLRPGERAALGLHAFPDAEGGGKLGLWAGYRREDPDSGRWRFDVRAHVDDLWADPFSAVGLGGRTSGLEVEGFRALDARWWTQGSLRYAEVSIDAPGRGEVDDSLSGARLAVGRVLSAHVPRVADPAVFDRVGPLGFSPYLEARDAAADNSDGRLHVQAYLGLDHQRLGDGADLTALLPLAEETTYLMLGGRVDRLVWDDLGAMAEAVVGIELDEGDSVFGIDLGLTWRPRFALELFGRVGAGRALAREDDPTEFRGLIGVQLRR